MKPLKIIISLLVISIWIFGCNNSIEEEDIETCNLNPPDQEIHDKLVKAYNDSCTDCLKYFLDNWENEFSPNTNIPDSLQVIYDVYKEFYSPWDLDRIRDSESELEDNLYNSYSYYIIQSSLKYDSNFKEPTSKVPYIINNFHPEIANQNISKLYLMDKYKNAINCFIGSREFLPLEDDERRKRVTFLKNYLFLFNPPWTKNWLLETNPVVEKMSFNEAKDSVQVYFALRDYGGEAILAKKEGQWEIVDFYRTWIL